MTEKNKPAHKIRSGTGLTVTIWKNDGDNGPIYTVTATRSYKQGEEWKETNSYHQHDLLELAEMFREARTWIRAQAIARAADDGPDVAQAGHADRETGPQQRQRPATLAVFGRDSRRGP
jgi:hypothetical protein